MRNERRRGFTLVELIGVIAGCGMVALAVLVQYTDRRDQARESALRGNLETIRVAVERYAVDFEEYPVFLLGGDLDSWDAWHLANDEVVLDPQRPSNRSLHDPLIARGYLTSYPPNPFLTEGGSGVLRQSHGDPRFGSAGSLMGNGVDDPKVWRRLVDWSDMPLETWRTQAPFTKSADDAVMYAMGGRRGLREIDGEPEFYNVATWWPGQFCYRGVESLRFSRKGTRFAIPGIFGWSYDRVVSYTLGVYGGWSEPGLDLVRLEAFDPAGNHLLLLPRLNSGPLDQREKWLLGLPPSFEDSLFGLPEMTGGGTAWIAPRFPYTTNLWPVKPIIHGSPDGQPDGIVAAVWPDEPLTHRY